MAAKCVNIQHPDFKKLANEIGPVMAKSITVANNYVIPTVDEAITIIRGTKVKQFKNAITHMRSLKNPTIDELFKGFNGIVRKYGNTWYVVNGSKISDTPSYIASSEIEQPNLKFLEALNDTFGNIFKMSGTPSTKEGIRIITGAEAIVAGQSLPTQYVEGNSLDDVDDTIKGFRDSNSTLGSGYLRSGLQFAEGFIPGPASMNNQVKLPYANKSIAKKLKSLRTKFDAIAGNSETAKSQKRKIKSEMFKLTDDVFNEFKEVLKTNIRSIFDAWNPELIQRSRHWYDGANRIAQNFAKTYNISLEAAAGIIAVLSPQNEWFNNIAGADRVMNILQNNLTKPVTPAMYDNAITLSKGEPFEQVVRAIKEQYSDKSLGDILTLAENDTTYQDIAASIIRIIDLSVHGPSVDVVTPEGVASGIKVDTGGLTRFAWGSSNEIYKAVSIYQDPSIENIAKRLGKGSKVRNFYNNIANPNSDKNEVTVDTHAMAAAFMNVVSAEEASAMNLFRAGGHPIYAIIKEAYQEIGAEKNFKPREVQSVVWEAIRLLIKESEKTDVNRQFINDIWEQVQNKNITHEQAIEQIFGNFEFGRPQWDRTTNKGTSGSDVRESEASVQQRNGPDRDIRRQQPVTTQDNSGVGERDLISETEKIRYMTEDNDGNYVFYHYSDKDLSKKGIDPNKTGNNLITGRDEKPLAPAAFYYTEPGIQESGLGNFGHVVKIPKNKVYPFNEDPLNLLEEAENRFKEQHPDLAFDLNKQVAWVSVVANENGYPVTVANWDGVRGFKKSLRAQSPVKLTGPLFVQPVDGSLNTVKSDPTLEYKSNRRKKIVQPITLDEQLLTEIENKSGKVYKTIIDTARKNKDASSAIDYFIDKAVESPDKFDREFGEELTDKLIDLASTDQLQYHLYNLNRINPDNASIPVLEQLIAKRNKNVKPGKQLFSEPNYETELIETAYQISKNLPTEKGQPIYSLDIEYSKKIADAYEAMANNPTDPEVQASYEAMANETMEQFYAIQNAGYTIEIFEGKGEPYANSQEMIDDVRDNKHQYILSTENDFGTTPITDQQRSENPLLRDSGEKDVNGKNLVINDIFRYVHDFFGHTMRGNSFGPVGEENAWDVHARMYTPLARRAMTAETRGQNSWVNFGPHMRNEDGSIKKKGDPGFLSSTQRPFAEQKSGILPEEFSQLPEERGEERVGLKPAPTAVKVDVDEQTLSKFTQENHESEKVEESGWKPISDDIDFQKLNNSQWSSEQLKRFALDNIIRMLKTKFNIKMVVVNEPGSYWRGKYSAGVVTINEAYVTPDTAFHEVLHPFMDVLKKENPELYDSLLDEVKNSERGKEYFEHVKLNYPELSEEDQWDETLVEILGYMSATQHFDNGMNKSLFEKFIDWLKTVLTKMGVMTQEFNTSMSLESFAALMVNPSFVFDLGRKIDSENHAERYSKLSNTFDEVVNRVREKLKADASSRTKAMTEDTSRRKYFSGKIADALTEDSKDLKAIDNFIMSSASNLKKLNDKFEDFKINFESKKTKTPDDLAELGKLLNEIEDCITLYEDVDLLINATLAEFPDAEDAIGNLKKNYSKEAALINSYKAYSKELVVNWLFPHAKSAINKAIATDKPFTVVSKNMYEAVQKELQSQNITDKRQILETAFKRELASFLTTAKKDASAVTQFLGPLLHSRDPLSALIARAVVEEYTGALKKGLGIQEKLTKLVRQVRGVQLFNTNEDHFNFYGKYLRQATSFEYKGINEQGEPEYEEVKRWAFHEEYKWDEFYKDKREFENKLGPSPSKNDTVKWNAWKSKQDAWYAQFTNKSTNSKGQDVRIPADKYKNVEFAALQGDKLFKELYQAYKEANNKVGKQGLKYGIIPQDRVLNFKPEKGKVVKTAVEKLRLFIGEEDQVYFAQKNNLKEKQSIPVPFTRMVDEKELSFDLLNSVTRFATSAEKYNSISGIEPHVNILKNFIGGNASLGIDPRQVVKVSASGIKALSKAERKAMQVEATRINNQLDSFLNDVIYGQPMKKATVQMFNSKFKVVDKNGNVEIIKGFDNLTEYIRIPDLDYSGFEVGTERKLKDFTVTMIRKDWNWSVKKAANNLGLLTAFQQIALNNVSGVINVVRGKLETFIEGAGGRYFNLGNALEAEGIYFRALGAGDFFEDIKGGKPSFLSDMLIRYDGIQGELMDELGKKIPGSIANRVFRRNHLFFMQQGGEHYVQTQLMVALMLHRKVKLNNGTELSLYEARKKEFNGSLNFATDTTWTEEDDADFRQEVKFVNTNMHGNYNKLDKAYLQRTWWGSLLMMFRKHIYTGFASRYRGVFGQGGYVNYQTGDYTQGYYITFFKGLVNQMRSLIEQKRMGQLSEDERYAFRKIAADFTAMMLLMMSFKMFDDDDDDEEFNDYMALVSRRLISEGVQYTPVVGTLDLAKVVTNPAASVSTVDKVWTALQQSIEDPTAEYERSGAGYEAGQNKAAVKWGRALPLYRQYINSVEPERLLQFYGTNSIWFLKPDAGKGEDEED